MKKRNGISLSCVIVILLAWVINQGIGGSGLAGEPAGMAGKVPEKQGTNAPVLPLNGDFENWVVLTNVPAGWTLNQGQFPGEWLPEERPGSKGFAIKKVNQPVGELGGASLYLDGRILSRQRYAGYRQKRMLVTLMAKGEKGSLAVYLREYSNVKNDQLKWVAIAMKEETDSEWREYSGVVDMTPYHGDDAIQIDLEGKGVFIDNVRVSILESDEGGKQKKVEPVCVLPRSAKTPVVDGKYTPEEWAGSVGFKTGFINFQSGNAIARQSECYLASDGTNLYFCFLLPVRPGGLKSEIKARDGNVWEDESVEIYVHPTYGTDIKDVVYQFVVNASGVVFDQAMKIGMGQMETGWNCVGLEVKRGNYQGNIVLEALMPLEQVGIRQPGKDWGLNICRNLRYPDEYATLTGGAFQDFDFMMRCRVAEGGPAMQWGYGGKTAEGKFKCTAKVNNPGDKPFSGKLLLKTGPIVVKEEQRDLSLAPQKTETVVLDIMDQVIKQGLFACELKDGEKALFRQEIPFKTDDFFEVAKTYETERKLNLEYYPIQGKINIRIPTVPENEQEQYGRAIVWINGNGWADEQAVEKPLFIERAGHVTVPFSAPKPGKYIARAMLMNKTGEVMNYVAGEIEKKNPEWIGNGIGKDRVVVPPFTPLKYSRDEVSCLGRQYVFGKGGLPESVIAAGKELLAGPVRLVCELSDGDAKSSLASFSFNSKEEDRAEFRSGARFGGIDVKLEGWMEYDGVVFYKMDVVPEGKVKVERLALEIPVNDPKLLHAVSDSMRENSTFAFIRGKEGVLWTSLGVKNRSVYGNFEPYAWVGDNERGICWFAENDRGWVNDAEHACLELTRKGKEVVLRVNFITGPYELTKARHIEFGLMATPIKPRNTGLEINPLAKFHGGFGGFFNVGLSPIDPWLSRIILVREKDGGGHVYTAGQEYPIGDDEFKYLSDETAHEPFGRYTLSLSGLRYKTHGDSSDDYISRTVCWTPERVDYNLYMIKTLFELGMGGMYLDNSYPCFCRNIQHRSCGYIRDDGHVQYGCHLLLTREYIKRVATLAYLSKKPRPWVSVHTTHALLAPCFSFADIWLSGEMGIPPDKDHMDVFPPAVAEIHMGVNWGTDPEMLTMLGYGERSKTEKPTRTMLALFKLYDVRIYPNGCNTNLVKKFQEIEKDFSTCAEDSEFVGYWQEEKARAVIIDPPQDVKASFYVRPAKGALIYVTNFAKEPRPIKLKLDLSRFGIAGGKLLDGENQQELKMEGDVYPLTVAGRDFRVLELRRITK